VEGEQAGVPSSGEIRLLFDFRTIAKPTLRLGEIPPQKCQRAERYRVDDSPGDAVCFAERPRLYLLRFAAMRSPRAPLSEAYRNL
jgi:hypothetical protein